VSTYRLQRGDRLHDVVAAMVFNELVRCCVNLSARQAVTGSSRSFHTTVCLLSISSLNAGDQLLSRRSGTRAIVSRTIHRGPS